jgi:hypothetical protein
MIRVSLRSLLDLGQGHSNESKLINIRPELFIEPKSEEGGHDTDTNSYQKFLHFLIFKIHGKWSDQQI